MIRFGRQRRDAESYRYGTGSMFCDCTLTCSKMRFFLAGGREKTKVNSMVEGGPADKAIVAPCDDVNVHLWPPHFLS